jgi:NADH-quinone oxidoreductase subunit H
MLPLLIEALVKIAILIAGLMTAAAYLVLLERRVAAWVQDRKGPNRVGIPLTRVRLFGLGQPLADGVKFIAKEEFTPAHVDKFFFFAGPIVMFVAALAVFAVVPFGSVEIFGRRIALVVAPHIDVGLIYIFAVSSIAVYGVVLGSWASNNKYGFFGGLRSGAQLISYEIPLGLGLLGVVVMSGSLQLEEVIRRQAESGIWNIWAQPLGFIVFAVASFAEAARLPFDLPEAEQELVGGYHTEYSGIKLMMYLVAEYMHMVGAAFLMVILFFGGWHLWGLTGSQEVVTWPVALLRVAVFAVKVLAAILMFMVTRWSWPRFRFDQLMTVAWKVMLPWGLVNVVVVAAWVEYGPRLVQAAGWPAWLLVALIGWPALLVTWLVTALLTPAASDNRPRLQPLALQQTEEGAIG